MSDDTRPTLAEAEKADAETGAAKLNELGKEMPHRLPERGQVEALNAMGKELNLQAEAGAQEFAEETKGWWDRAKGFFKRSEAPKGEAEIMAEIEKSNAAFAAFKQKYDAIMASGDEAGMRGLEKDLAQTFDVLAPQVAAESGKGVTETGAMLNDVTRRLGEVRAKLGPAPAVVAEVPKPTSAMPSLNEVLTGKEAVPQSLSEKEAVLVEAGAAKLNEAGKDMHAPTLEAEPLIEAPTPEESEWAAEMKRDAADAAQREKLLSQPGIKGTPAEALVDDYLKLQRHGMLKGADGEPTGLSFDAQNGMIKVTYANGLQVRKYANGLLLRIEPGGKVENVPTEPPKEKQAVETHTYENAKGEPAIFAEARLDEAAETIDVKQEFVAARTAQELLTGKSPKVKARRLQELQLASPESGKMVKLLESLGLQDVEVYVAEERVGNYYYDPEKRHVIVPPLETALDVAVALHELGHADQAKDERLEALEYGDRMTSEQILDAVPEAREIFDREKVRAFWEASARLTSLHRALNALETAERNGEEVDAEELQALRKEADEQYQKTAALERESKIDDLMRLPTRILERDATARALVWARKLRAQGVDLLSSALVPKGMTVEGRMDACSDSVAQAAQGGDEGAIVTDIVKDLKSALASYGADRPLPQPRDRDRKKAAGEIEASVAPAEPAVGAPSVSVDQPYAEAVARETPKTSERSATVSGEFEAKTPKETYPNLPEPIPGSVPPGVPEIPAPAETPAQPEAPPPPAAPPEKKEHEEDKLAAAMEKVAAAMVASTDSPKTLSGKVVRMPADELLTMFKQAGAITDAEQSALRERLKTEPESLATLRKDLAKAVKKAARA